MVDVIDTHLDKIKQLCEQFLVEELYIFGSAAEGHFAEDRSDVDFLVRFFPCSPIEHKDRYFGLLESFQDLLDRSVDLVEIDAVTNSYFRREAERSRIPIYAA